jgi:hypothetical protein
MSNQIHLTPEEIAKEAALPYSQEDAMSALKLGFAHELSDAGILPSEFESLMKEANIIDTGVGTLGQLAGLGMAGGALVGGYTGYLRHRVEKAIEGKNDPDLVKLNNSLKMYREMSQDLRRTNAVAA